MFRGGDQAKIDNKGRLKIPAQHRQTLFAEYGPEIFMTVIRDRQLTIYPLEIWKAKEQKLLHMPDSVEAKHRFLTHANFFGAAKTVDDQGRVAIPAHIRKRADLLEDVAVISNLHTLQVMGAENMERFVDENPLDASTFEALREYGF
jgi:MraZ protein